MRIAGLLILLCLDATLVGCKNKGEADAAQDPAALKAQAELIARRDKLLEDRKKLQSERDKLDSEIKDLEAKGSDATEQKKKAAEIDNQLETSNVTLESIGTKVDAISKSADKTAQVAAREASIASREKAVAEREAKAADRERLLAQRDYESAQRWKDSCSTGTPMIIQSAAPKGGKYDKKDVSALISKAKREMAKKGLLNGDLPGPAQDLESEASKSLNENDMSKAYFAAMQLVGTVDGITVNRQFIQAKHARLSTQVKATKVDEGMNKQFADILGEVMQKFGDGDFNAANRRLNQLAGLLAKQQ